MGKKIKIFICIVTTGLINQFILSNAVKAQEWATKFENNEIKVTYHLLDCSDQINGIYIQYAALKFENKTRKALTVDFYKEMWFNGKCFNCDPTENNQQHNYNITVLPREIKEGGCENRNQKELMIYSKHLDFESASKLTDFNLHINSISKK